MLDRTAVVILSSCMLLAALVGCGGQEEPASPGPPAEGRGAAPTLEEMAARVEDEPDDVDLRHAYAIALHRTGRRDEAVTQLEQIVERKPDAIHLIELGVAYASVSRLADAEGAFLRALESSPGNPVVLHHLANLARGRGESTEAISLYRQAVQADPDYLMAHFHLAESLREAQQLEQAYQSYESVVNLQPRSPTDVQALDASLMQLAALDLQMGATERAVQFLEILIEARPDHPQAHGLLAQAYMKLGRAEDARSEMETHQRIAQGQPGQPPGPSGTPQPGQP